MMVRLSPLTLLRVRGRVRVEARVKVRVKVRGRVRVRVRVVTALTSMNEVGVAWP